jgi:Domain of unknown function (DUF4956)
MVKNREQSASAGDGLDGRERGLSPAARRLLWIVAYYAVAGAAVALLWRSSPDVRQLLESDRLRELAQGSPFSRSQATETVLESAASGDWRPGILTLLALAGALLTALPVAWIYSLTRRKKGFEQSMVHTLILLPLAIAGMVVLIQNSLALAFSLAGIVALLRFRNTLEDTKDGVYVFVATTIGISAAVGVLVVGIVTSVVFNVVVLALWWIDFARTPTPGIRGGIRRLARLPKLTPVRSPAPAVPAARREWMPDEVFATAAQTWRRQLGLTAEHRALDPEGRFNTTLRVHTVDLGATQPIVEQILGEQVKRWQLVGVLTGDGGRSTLKYLVRLRKDARGELLNAVRQHGTPQVVGVEFR